jgi:hypothetical protein
MGRRITAPPDARRHPMIPRLSIPLMLACAGLAWPAVPAQPTWDAFSESIPRTTVRVEKNQRMLALTVQGDPDLNGDSAMQALLRHFFAGAGEPEMNEPVQPRVRWLLRSPSLPRRAWIGIYGLPISETFPEPARGPAVVDTWAYGLIAESGYAGPYAGAQPAIDSLKAFVLGRGFTLFGGLEEVYVRGRGTLDQGNPAGYVTLIRYRVRELGDFPSAAPPLSANP